MLIGDENAMQLYAKIVYPKRIFPKHCVLITVIFKKTFREIKKKNTIIKPKAIPKYGSDQKRKAFILVQLFVSTLLWIIFHKKSTSFAQRIID